MFDTVIEWFNIAVRWVINNPGYCLLGIVGVGVVQTLLEKIWPCMFGHVKEGVTRVLHESANVRTSTVDFYCKRCGKKL